MVRLGDGVGDEDVALGLAEPIGRSVSLGVTRDDVLACWVGNPCTAKRFGGDAACAWWMSSRPVIAPAAAAAINGTRAGQPSPVTADQAERIACSTSEPFPRSAR